MSTQIQLSARYLLYFLCSFIICQEAQSQNKLIDSLKKSIDLAANDTIRAQLFADLSRARTPISLEFGLKTIDSSIFLARSVGDSSTVAYALLVKGHLVIELGKYEEALEVLQNAKTSNQYINDSLRMSYINTYLGTTHLRMGNYEKALDYTFRAAKIAEYLESSEPLSTSYNVIGEIYLYSLDTANAKKYYLKSLSLLNKEKDLFRKSFGLMNVAQVETNEQNKMDYLNEAIQISKENGFDITLAYCYGQLGDWFMHKKEYNEAINYYELGLQNARSSGDVRMINYNLIYMSDCWLELGNIDSAAFTFSKITDKENIEEVSKWKIPFYESRINVQSGTLQKSYELLDSAFTQYRDYYQTELAGQVSEANTKYETEKKEAEIARQQLEIEQQRNTRKLLALGSTGVLVILGVSFFGFYQRNKRKRRETELALQLEKQRAQDLEDLSKVKTDFFNNVSHELRTPLTLIMAPLEDALKGNSGKDNKQELQMALHNSKRLLNLTNEILDLSKIEAAKLSLEKMTIDIQSFLLRVFHSFDSLSRTRRIQLIHNLNANQSTYGIIDAGKVEKVLNNLISNAIKYSADGGRVRLELDQDSLENGQLTISIADEGKGIPKEEQERIFDRFYQPPGTSQSSGTGIGLALVKELVQLLSGNITLKSELEKGSTFTINLPIELVENTIQKEVVTNLEDEMITYEPILINGHKPTVLIVEDDLEMSKYLEGLLKDDYKIDVAYNGVQALQKCSEQKYDLISSDIMMPEMDGFEFRERIIALGKDKDIPFIMLTARVMEEDRLHGFRLGVDDYITKPFSSAEFKARVYNLISNKQSRAGVELEREEMLSHKEAFIRKAESAVLDHLDDPSFNVEALANKLNYSTRQLGRILQKYTGLTPVKFILEIRLQKAFQIIQARKYATINEVRYEVGIESASYFSSKFKQRFGLAPAELITSI